MGKRGRMWGNKKALAKELLLEAMQLLAAIMILTGSVAYANNKLERVGFFKSFYAIDIGLMLTAFHAAPGSPFQLYYVKPLNDTDKNKFHFVVADNFVLVNASSSPHKAAYWYFSDFNTEEMRYDLKMEEEESILNFSKGGNRIRVDKVRGERRKEQVCPFVSTEEGAWLGKRFIIDPAHGENASDMGAVNENNNIFNEAGTTIAIAISSGLQLQNRILTRKEGTYARISARENIISENAGSDSVIISIHTGSNPNTRVNRIKAYYNSLSGEETRLKNKKLGCNILNSIVSYEGLENSNLIEGLAVMPSDSEYIRKIIPEGAIGVLLELGNMQIPENTNFLSDTTGLAEAIYEGLRSYHEE